jgi:glycosyltransferase involved in cell wall biosynthesis
MDRVVCVSEAQAAKVRHAGVDPERVVVIANAIRGDRFPLPSPAARAELERMLGRPCTRLVAAAGRLSPEKGFQVLVEAAGRIHDPAIGFLMFGEGTLRAEMERRIAALGLQDRFILAGHHADLDRLIPAVDLLVLPSFTEGMPNVVLEALAAGVPVVATSVGGTPEVLNGTCGRLVPAGDPVALAVGILDVLADETRRRRMGQRGQERVRQHFTFDAQAEQYVALLKELVVDLAAAPGRPSLAGSR